MISSERRTISGLRRISTPSAPVAKRKAATARYQLTSGPFISRGSPPPGRPRANGGRGQEVEDGERAEVPDQRERRVEGVREADDGDPGGDAREGSGDPDDPDEDVPGGGRDDHECSL